MSARLPLRERRIVSAALRTREANEDVRAARADSGRGTRECRMAVERRKQERTSLLYHAAALRGARP
jgi:hypothetical protein